MIVNFFFKSFGSPLWFLYSARSRDLARINYKEKGNRLRLCLFSRIYFLGNHFLNFPVFVCYYESWSMENIFRSTENTFSQRKHFPVNEKHFPVNGNTFRSKKKLVWFPGKCFLFWLCLFSGKWFPENHFPNFPVFVWH